MTYSAGGNQLGNLTYSYDASGRVVSKGGSFAQTNLPAAVSGNTFDAANVMTAFGGQSRTYASGLQISEPSLRPLRSPSITSPIESGLKNDRASSIT